MSKPRTLYLKWGWEYIARAILPGPQHLPPGMPKLDAIYMDQRYSWKSDERGHAFVYEFPYNPIKRDEVVARLQRCGYRILNRKLEKGDDVIYMKHTNESCWIRLDFAHYIKGSTCRKVQIGSEIVTREEAIYEVVCEEGAEEAIF
jgi:hypothetical protein